ncbi:MAG: metallophosphatase family protein [Anaerolineaceae bacterium]|nr:metallophosphatase family protein [Anaerolineaceae bacterium]
MSKNHKIAILSDTHVGDRVSQLNPALFSALQDEKPDQILHAGDVCTPEAIAQLETIAPTLVVQGNRDWFLGYKPPKDVHLEIHGLKIALAHGHFSIWHWFWNYVHLFLTRKGQDHRFYQEKLARYYPDADVIVFGHLHYPYREVRDGKLYLNPGAGYPEWRNNYRPGYMILDIKPDGSYTTVLKYTNPQAD